MYRRLHQGGLSLVELMVTLAVLIILIGGATANWQPLIESHQARAMQTELRTAFHLARFHAIHQRTLVSLCPLDITNQCSNDWNQPISVFYDPTNARALNSTEQLIRTFDPPAKGRRYASKSGIYERKVFQFRADGSVFGSIGNLTWCPASNDARHAVHMVVSFGGRIRWAQDRDLDGIVETASGKPINCTV